MPHQTDATTQVARKAHRCTWCWQCISIGESYARYRYFDGGDSGVVKMHPECHSVMQEAAQEEGGFIEWTPGQERPAKHAEKGSK